jgi:hypothetical protein
MLQLFHEETLMRLGLGSNSSLNQLNNSTAAAAASAAKSLQHAAPSSTASGTASDSSSDSAQQQQQQQPPPPPPPQMTTSPAGVLHLRQSEPNFIVATRSFADLRLHEWGEWEEDSDLLQEENDFEDSEDDGESPPLLQHAALQQHNSSSALAAAAAAGSVDSTVTDTSSVNGNGYGSAAVPGLAAVRTVRQHSSRSSRCASSGSSTAGGRRTLVACAVAAFRISGCPTVQHSEYQVRAAACHS